MLENESVGSDAQSTDCICSVCRHGVVETGRTMLSVLLQCSLLY
jgi:hypothetical protein